VKRWSRPTRRTWCLLAVGGLYVAVAGPAGWAVADLASWLLGGGPLWAISMVVAGLCLVAGLGLRWLMGEVGAQRDRLELSRTTPDIPLPGRNAVDKTEAQQ
jgi:hypothetical protein